MTSLLYCLHCLAFVFTWAAGMTALECEACYIFTVVSSPPLPALIGGNWRHCYTFWMRLFNWISVQSKNNKHENPGWVRTKNAWNWFFKTKIETTKTLAGLQQIVLVYHKYLFWLTRQLYNRVHNLQSNQSPNTFVA